MRKAKQNINKHIYIYCQKENMGLKDKHTDIIVFIFFLKKGKRQTLFKIKCNNTSWKINNI